ncbi:MAG TPA: ACT domain-containing protein [Actinomycetota bacterium]|jgi:hypothetical protein|nr:ACT domain-containing protein [Actinomycetota bacterium]
MATDITITVEDRPGGLASIGEALGNAGVNIEGVCGLGFEGRGIIHVCVMDAATARQALDAAGLKVEGEADAILTEPVSGATQPGTLGEMSRRIADAGINVRALYLATGDRGVVVTDDNEKAASMMSG